MKSMLLLLLLVFSVSLNPAFAETKGAPVYLDQKALFTLKAGSFGYSVEVRAKGISGRLEMLAKDYSIAPETITVLEGLGFSQIVAGDRLIFPVQDADAAASDGKTRQQLAQEYADIIKKAIVQFRIDYSRKQIVRGIVIAIVSTLVVVGLIALLLRLYRRVLEKLRERAVQRYGKILEDSRAMRVLESVIVILNLLRFIVLSIVVVVYLEVVLGSLPWTRAFAERMLGFILVPLQSIKNGLIAEIPDLFFLVVLIVIVNYSLKLLHILFNLIELGRITIQGFDPEWSRPTYNIVRFVVIAFSLVVAFPYLPGSESPAFKGISVFIGVLFSLGSSSAVAGVIAGLSLTYRKAFRVGDVVRIGDVIGVVHSMRLSVTQLRTAKNEVVTIPNSETINSTITNYTSLAVERGLILHSSVTIGYDVPWRQVESLLLLAASRTPGLLADPPPFVLQRALQDFYVQYELNAYTNDTTKMLITYSRLHQNIQDAFNEYGVQIMSPNYEADPEKPKIVPKDQWFAAPARKEE